MERRTRATPKDLYETIAQSIFMSRLNAWVDQAYYDQGHNIRLISPSGYVATRSEWQKTIPDETVRRIGKPRREIMEKYISRKILCEYVSGFFVDTIV